MGNSLFMTTTVLQAFIQGGISRLGALFLSISLDFFDSFLYSSFCLGFDMVADFSYYKSSRSS